MFLCDLATKIDVKGRIVHFLVNRAQKLDTATEKLCMCIVHMM